MSDAGAGEALTGRAAIAVGNNPAMPISADADISVTVEDSRHTPARFAIEFSDKDGDIIAKSGLQIGASVEISTPAGDLLIAGEVTGYMAQCRETMSITTVVGYSLDHRLQTRRKARVFPKHKYSEIVKEVAREHGIKLGKVDKTKAEHPFVPQCNESDWEFLRRISDEIGFELTMVGRELNFRRPADMPTGGLSAGPVIGLGGAPPVELVFGKSLLVLDGQVSGVGLTTNVEIRTWGGSTGQARASTRPTDSGANRVEGFSSKQLADKLNGGGKRASALKGAAPAIPVRPGTFGPAPDSRAFVVSSRVHGAGSASTSALDEAAAGLAAQIADTAYYVSGQARGDGKIFPGGRVSISGVQDEFCGTFTITKVQHTFDQSGYFTRFVASGSQDRDFFRPAVAAAPAGQISGLVPGIVTNCNDPEKLGRVKVVLPVLSTTFETDWASVVSPGLGPKAGIYCLPRVGDQVLVAFEFSDPRRAYVLGGVVNDETAIKLKDAAVKAKGETADVVQRGLETPYQKITFTDEGGPSGPPTKAVTIWGAADASKFGMTQDLTGGSITIVCDPQKPGTITIKTGASGKIVLDASPSGELTINAGKINIKAAQTLNIEAAQMTQEAKGPFTIKGKPIQLN